MTTRRNKICPFCGKAGNTAENLTCVVKDSARAIHYVECGHCRARGPESDWWQGAWEAWDLRNEAQPLLTALQDISDGNTGGIDAATYAYVCLNPE